MKHSVYLNPELKFSKYNTLLGVYSNILTAPEELLIWQAVLPSTVYTYSRASDCDQFRAVLLPVLIFFKEEHQSELYMPCPVVINHPRLSYETQKQELVCLHARFSFCMSDRERTTNMSCSRHQYLYWGQLRTPYTWVCSLGSMSCRYISQNK